MRTNKDRVIMHSVMGKVSHPKFGGYRVDTDGKPYVIPGTGAINYNVKVGDSVYGWAGDHIEPGVTIKNEDGPSNHALNVFACAGNQAKIVTGDAKGAIGYVLGSHGGVDHVMVQFDQDTLEQMTTDDKILIKGFGQGFELLDYPEIKMMSLDPTIFEKMGVKEIDGKLSVPVTAKIPHGLMGSGVGAPYSQAGDYDLITSDMTEIKRLGLNSLRFGDFVLIENTDCSYGLGGYLEGAVSIGIIVHSDCIKNGHGPGISILMTTKKPLIEGRIDLNANLAHYMK
ncbi:DUF4438 domain-containing protein [Fusibacter tunisiensis]|uniref:DUF4438 domain-containing protein n=1 Tax=Fusibacter tunisiensis TaxID=1008308 RepID=A0ABS2MP12_9FIRM|nr:DUF4438 domain-containing protein [Fusibacter tunisiensis]MBM7561135.1 hypothetical protein [Fusibacter tunisiensis]